MKLLEAGESEGGKHLIPKAIDADDEDDNDASTDNDSDDEVCRTWQRFARAHGL